MTMNFNEVPEVNRSILQIGKIILSSIYSGNSMNSSATFFTLQTRQVQSFKE